MHAEVGEEVFLKILTLLLPGVGEPQRGEEAVALAGSGELANVFRGEIGGQEGGLWNEFAVGEVAGSEDIYVGVPLLSPIGEEAELFGAMVSGRCGGGLPVSGMEFPDLLGQVPAMAIHAQDVVHLGVLECGNDVALAVGAIGQEKELFARDPQVVDGPQSSLDEVEGHRAFFGVARIQVEGEQEWTQPESHQ